MMCDRILLTIAGDTRQTYTAGARYIDRCIGHVKSAHHVNTPLEISTLSRENEVL